MAPLYYFLNGKSLPALCSLLKRKEKRHVKEDIPGF
jgi:hypothetical protein